MSPLIQPESVAPHRPSPMREPNFLIAGSGESGTSWLSACLMHHPQIFLPKEMRPEPHFFFKSQEYVKGYDYYLARYFSQVPEQAIAVGERSSSYMFSPVCIERIAQQLPDVKLILMLREPIGRAYSNWRFSVQSGLETESFERAIALEARRAQQERNPFWREVKPYAYLERSCYGPQVAKVMAHFAPAKVLILNSDQVKKDEPGALKRVCEFLGVSPDFDFPNPGTFPTSSVKNRKLQAWLRKQYGQRFDEAIEATRRKHPGEPINIWWDWLLKRNLHENHPHLNAATRQELQTYFAESNRQLAPYIDWDPMVWA